MAKRTKSRVRDWLSGRKTDGPIRISGGAGNISARGGGLFRTRRDGSRWTSVPLAHRKATNRRRNREARASRRRNRAR